MFEPAPIGRRATLIPRVTALSGHPDTAAALDLLHAIAWTVEPVQRARGWVVGQLAEFLPRIPNLLGQNAGGGGGRALCIRIRLRPPPGSRRRRASGAGFLPFDDLVQTMLHELTHCVLGRHDAAFYALLDELSRECDAHRARGVGGTGAGFDAPSAGRIGGWRPGASDAVGAPVPALVRAAAAAAAERRAARGSIMPAGPRTVGGGGSDWARLSPREAAAAAAARRAADEVWCGGEGVVVEEEEDQGEIIVLSD